jgi:hypothetical protein
VIGSSPSQLAKLSLLRCDVEFAHVRRDDCAFDRPLQLGDPVVRHAVGTVHTVRAAVAREVRAHIFPDDFTGGCHFEDLPVAPSTISVLPLASRCALPT